MADQEHTSDESETEREMAKADQANGEGSPSHDKDDDQSPVNTTEAKYGQDESPA